MTPHLLSRRSILALAASAALGGCVGVPVRRFEASVEEPVTVSVTDFLRAAGERNAMLLQVKAWPVSALLLRDPIKDLYWSLSARCTHLGCTVRAGTGELRCPCHGSSFALDGAVLAGPAPAPLAPLGCEREGDAIRVFIPPDKLNK